MGMIYICSVKNDEGWKRRLLSQLEPESRLGGFQVWHDEMVPLGTKKHEAKQTARDNSSIAILLVSPSSLESRSAQEEWRDIFAKSDAGKILVMPVILEPCPWQSVPALAELVTFPRSGRPLASGSEREIETQLQEIVKAAADAVGQLSAPNASGSAGPLRVEVPETTVQGDEAAAPSPAPAAPAQVPAQQHVQGNGNVTIVIGNVGGNVDIRGKDR